MNRIRGRVAAASSAALLFAGSLALTACTLPVDHTSAGALEAAPADGGAASSAPADGGAAVLESTAVPAIPTSWPKAVPVYEGGTLTAADGDPAGTYFSASWDVTTTPDAVAKEYGEVFSAAGFVAGETFVDDSNALTVFTGNGFTVTVYASVLSDGQVTELTVTVESSS